VAPPSLPSRVVADGGRRDAVQPGRGNGFSLPLPGQPHPHALDKRPHDSGRIAQCHELVESRMRGDSHVRFGGAGRGNGPNRETAPRPGPTLLVGGEHEVPLAKAPSLPGAGVEVQDSPGLGAEVGVPGEDPAAVGPGPGWRPSKATARWWSPRPGPRCPCRSPRPGGRERAAWTAAPRGGTGARRRAL